MLKGYRTLIVASIITVLGSIQGLNWATLIPDKTTAGWVVFVIGVIMMLLRSITNTTVTKVTSPAPMPK